jgi:serine kinase of HPr protein (carbohydrate metabolism regulator)
VNDQPTIHASAVLVGPKAALIRGPSGSGKSRLAFDLIEAARRGALAFARLVADDRVQLTAMGGQLLLRPAPALAGMIEVYGLGIRRLPHEPLATAGLVVDLQASDAERHPLPQAAKTVIEGVALPRLAVAAGAPPLPTVLAFLSTSAAGD